MSRQGYCELMCRDHVVASFLWGSEKSRVRGKIRAHDIDFPPPGCIDRSGALTKASLTAWLSNRSIPVLRPCAVERLREHGWSSPVDLMVAVMGPSLSDQYWIRPEGGGTRWSDVNCFENDFSPLLGELLLSHDQDSIPETLRRLADSASMLGSSPDAALNGNLPKRWECREEGRVLVKGGKPENRFQEPANEAAATALCELVLEKDDFVPYRIEGTSFPEYRSVCPCMVDSRTEFVPAINLYRSYRKNNDESLHGFFVRICREHEIEPSLAVEKMLAVDFLSANRDRHWNNFGVLVDCETRAWSRLAPVFDTGESFWCDKPLAQAFGGYETRTGAERPFGTDLDGQFERFCTDLSWLDLDALDEFVPAALAALSTNAMVANEDGRTGAIERALRERVDAVREKAGRNRGVLSKQTYVPESENFLERRDRAKHDSEKKATAAERAGKNDRTDGDGR